MYNKLFESIENDSDYHLTQLLMSGTLKMKEKLSTYAENQLPGGCYDEVKEVLCHLKPSKRVDLRIERLLNSL